MALLIVSLKVTRTAATPRTCWMAATTTRRHPPRLRPMLITANAAATVTLQVSLHQLLRQ